jgi:hypothetical protein
MNMNDVSLSDGTYYEGFWSFRNEEVEVLMDEATFDAYLEAYLVSHGIDTRTSTELLANVATIGRQHYEAEQVLFDPDYWLQMADPNIRIIQLKKTWQSMLMDGVGETSKRE